MEYKNHNDFENLSKSVDLIKVEVDLLKGRLDGKKITAKLKEQISNFDLRYSEFLDSISQKSDYNSLSRHADTVGIYGEAISQSIVKIQDGDSEISEIRKRLGERSSELRSSIEDREIFFHQDVKLKSNIYEDIEVVDLNSYKIPSPAGIQDTEDLSATFSRLQSEIFHIQRKVDSLSNNVDKSIEKLESLSEILPHLQNNVEEKVNLIQNTFDITTVNLEEKKNEVNKLVAIIAEGVIAGDYKQSAADEKKNANYLRFASLACMILIAMMVGYSFYETTRETFEWESSIVRLLYSVMLSIPAAYLARESTKHRLQQYSHLQMSLDLKAIDPYLSNLPEIDRHRLKAAMAEKLFVAREDRNSQDDSYPINTQELISAILGKVDLLIESKKKS